MPITPPTIEVPSRFDPVFITQDDLEDLATFSGMTREACLERLKSYSLREMAEAWRRADPKTPEEILRFYRTADLYIWELMQWHASIGRLSHWQALTAIADGFPPEARYRRVYDFGCGIGTDALFLASRGYEVTLVDVDGPAFHFAQHRFRRRGLPACFQASYSALPKPDSVYDVVVCVDVFEHLPDPLEAARRLVAALRPGGVLVQQGTFDHGDLCPCHLRDGIERFGGLRWAIELAGLGLRGQNLVYRKSTGVERIIVRARYVFWRLTGLWLHIRRVR